VLDKHGETKWLVIQSWRVKKILCKVKMHERGGVLRTMTRRSLPQPQTPNANQYAVACQPMSTCGGTATGNVAPQLRDSPLRCFSRIQAPFLYELPLATSWYS
jgi:hypothetical protein